MSAGLRQVADGCAYRVRSFASCDVNGYRFNFTQQGMSRVGPIKEPQIPEFLRKSLMGSSIMEELKQYTNSSFMVANL